MEKNYHSISAKTVISELSSNINGLSEEEAKKIARDIFEKEFNKKLSE